MPQPLMSLEILIALLVGMVAIGAFMMAARRRLISWGSLLLAVGYRSSPGKRWRMGLLRFGAESITWHSLLGISWRPTHTWNRDELILSSLKSREASDVLPSLPNASIVSCEYHDSTFDLAMEPAAYTALRSWTEAMPPGPVPRRS